MLTIFGRSDQKQKKFCDGYSRRNFLKIGGMALGGIALPHALRADSETRDRQQSPGDHQYLSARRAVAYRSVGSQAAGPQGNSRRFSADPDQRAGDRDLRTLPPHGPDDGQVHSRAVHQRCGRPARLLPVHDGPESRGPAAARRLAVGGRVRLQAARAGQFRRAAERGADVSDRQPHLGRTGHGRIFGAAA